MPSSHHTSAHHHPHDHDPGHAAEQPAPHGHHHHHHLPPERPDRAFAIGASINAAFVAAEVGFGIQANSMALLADAAHNLGDVLALLLAWGAACLIRRPPTPRRTYGWGRSSILAALINAMVLLVGVGAISVEALRRFWAPEPVAGTTVMIVAAAGILVNGGSALLFMRDRAHDLNVRAQFVHLAGDALVSFGVVAAAAVISLTGWLWLDPAASLAIAVVIIIGTWGVLGESVNLAMDAVPEDVPHEDVQAYLAAVPGVVEVHDLHIWGLSTRDTALTAHLVYAGESSDRRLHELTQELRHRFGIGHATLQIESGAEAALCHLRPDDVV